MKYIDRIFDFYFLLRSCSWLRSRKTIIIKPKELFIILIKWVKKIRPFVTKLIIVFRIRCSFIWIFKRKSTCFDLLPVD